MGETIEDLVTKLSSVNLADKQKDVELKDIIKYILNELDNADNETDKVVTRLLSEDVLRRLCTILNSTSTTLLECSAKLVAEIAKHEEARKPCVAVGLVPVLLKLLSNEDNQILIQVCRALGNICFDNDSGRQIVDGEGGINMLIDLLRRYLKSTTEDSERIRVVACGFLLNLTNSTETTQDKAILQGGIEILNEYLIGHKDDENVCQMALLSLGCLIESDLGKSKLTECTVAVTVGELLGTEVGEELQDLIFELLSSMAESDSVKLQLVKSSVIDRMLSLVRNNEHEQDEDSQAVVKMATDLIPTLLHGDISMEVLFQNGKGKLYNESLDWLKSSNQLLQVAGALTIGNFAIKDTNCVYLVSQGVHEKMIDLLQSTNSSGDHNPTLQHAVFSSLRNLSIPATNKVCLYKDGIVDRILPFVFEAEITPVQFKMLGTFRMLVDGQEPTATVLGTNEDFLKEIVGWSQIESHQGVKAESSRLISWLIKHSRNSLVMETVMKCGGTPVLCAMMHSEHAVMQNEALVSLTLMATQILDKVVADFEKSEVIPALKVMVTDDETLDEIMCNCITLCLCLSKSDNLKELMKLADFFKIFKDLSNKHDDSTVKEQAKNVYSVLE